MDVSSCLNCSARTILAGSILLLSIIYLYLRNVYSYWKKRNIPYEEPGNMILGNLSFIMRKSNWQYFKEMGQKYRMDYLGIYLSTKPALVVQTPELARKILVKDSENFQDRYLYSGYEADPLGSLNLFSVKNPIWSNMRHELSPLFTSARLKMITELMNINATQLVMRIKKDHIDDNKPVDLKELFSMYTSDTVAYSVFGIRVSVLNGAESPLWFITSHMLRFTFWRGLEFTMVFFLPNFAKLLNYKFFSDSATEYIKKLFWNVVDERKKTGYTSNRDLVNHLLKLKDNMKLPAEKDSTFADDLMLAQAAVFILGSIETSSTTLTYCFHELAHHPEEQQKLFEEVNEAFERCEKDVLDYDELMKLKYLSACVYETLRKHTPLAYLDRICSNKYKLNDDVVLEKGTPVYVNVLAIHYNPEIHPEPEQWRPERMMAASDNDTLQFTFLPFGDGPRFCIGKRYGMMQVRAALSQVIRKYRIEPMEGEPYQTPSDPYSVILAPKSGGRVKFVMR